MPEHEDDYRAVVGDVGPTACLPGTAIEIIRPRQNRRPPRYALFDFDGTVSLIREGWTEVMVAMMVEVLQATPTDESAETLAAVAKEFVGELTGKQTIYQMIRLAEEVQRRGGTPEDPQHYKQRYHDRLMARIAHRRERLRSGEARPEEMVVPGSLELLRELRGRGVRLYLASGTDKQYVIEEAGLLGLDALFGKHIHGALADYRAFSKAQVIERILAENRVEADVLVGFGDGYVEIQNVKQAGGVAVGVASDEAGRSGRSDPWKRRRLIGIGADLIVPDYADWRPLVAYLFGES
ncbi:MAG: HAD family hydrolase [Pirellulales bacterium]|nr:HAD family hydrolase [Pirellulales bacterium]